MERLCILIVLMLCFNNCSTAQESNCNRTLRYNNLKSKLDSAICIPHGYQIMRIDDVDLNNDGHLDKSVCWQKIRLSDGDTVFYSIYIRNKRNKLNLYKRLGNLRPLYFTSYESKTGNEFYDSIKLIYSYPSLSIVDFNTGTITTEFYTEDTLLKKLFFTYSVKEKTWILTREMQWFVPPKSYEGDEKLDENGRKLEYDRAPDQPMRIEDFDMLKYIGW